MKIINKYIDIVCLGYFNPKILTPEFLTKECKIDVEKVQLIGSPHDSPVTNELQYGNVKFSIQMDRFSISEQSVKDFSETSIIQYFEKYMSVLKYTPVYIYGLNLISRVTEINMESLEKKLYDINVVKKILNTDKITENASIRYQKDLQEWLSFNYKYWESDDRAYSINFLNKKDEIGMNFNYEISNLQKDYEKIKIIGKTFSQILENNDRILSSFFKG